MVILFSGKTKDFLNKIYLLIYCFFADINIFTYFA